MKHMGVVSDRSYDEAHRKIHEDRFAAEHPSWATDIWWGCTFHDWVERPRIYSDEVPMAKDDPVFLKKLMSHRLDKEMWRDYYGTKQD